MGTQKSHSSGKTLDLIFFVTVCENLIMVSVLSVTHSPSLKIKAKYLPFHIVEAWMEVMVYLFHEGNA